MPVARAATPAGTTAMRARDRPGGLRADGDFTGWYPRDGRPGLPPGQLAAASVPQFPPHLPDRDADRLALRPGRPLPPPGTSPAAASAPAPTASRLPARNARPAGYRGQPRTRPQHVLTATAVTSERPSQLPPGHSPSPRPPAASRDYPGQHHIKPLRSWRALSQAAATKTPDRLKL